MKTKKNVTDSYKNYTFTDDEFDPYVGIPNWLDTFPCILSDRQFFGFDEKDNIVIPVVYTFYDEQRHPLYVGKSISIIDRIYYHEYSKDKREPWMKNVVYIGLILCDSLNEMDIIEVLEIHKKLPKYNSDCRNDTKEYVNAVRLKKQQLHIQVFYEEEVFLYDDFRTSLMHVFLKSTETP